jgi:hypothetical protein
MSFYSVQIYLSNQFLEVNCVVQYIYIYIYIYIYTFVYICIYIFFLNRDCQLILQGEHARFLIPLAIPKNAHLFVQHILLGLADFTNLTSKNGT